MRKLPLSKCGLTSRGTFGIVGKLHYCYEQRTTLVTLSHESWGTTIEDENGIGYLPRRFFYVNHKSRAWQIRLWIPNPLGNAIPKLHLRKVSKSPLTMIMETSKFNGTNYNDLLQNLRIVLDFENQSYVLDKTLQMAGGGFSCFITFTDDHSQYGNVYLMRDKSEAFGRFKEDRLKVENQIGHKIKGLGLDRGGEYLSCELIDYLKENGILSQWTPLGTPQLNGIAEMRNRTLLDMV
ncbi:UNVERIFIED_CONTAM: hypothetical protein Sindi_1679200 [Sesamum indicum]